MNNDIKRPISHLVAAGWEIKGYSASIGDGGMLEHCFLMAKGAELKVVRVRKKFVGDGVTAEEIEV